MNLGHRLWQGRRCMKRDPAELLTCCVWLTWSNLCLCPQAWVAFQFSFSPRLTVISCWLNSSACLAIEYSLKRKRGESVPNVVTTFSASHPLHREKRVNISGQHNQTRQRCVVITISLWEWGPVALLWSGGVGTLDSSQTKPGLLFQKHI